MRLTFRWQLIAWISLASLPVTWAATPVKIGFPLELALGVRSSVELEFKTEQEKIYQVEVSTDLKNWVNDGYAIQGDGLSKTHITSTWDLPRLFFRVRDDGDPKRVFGGGIPGPVGPQGPPGESPTDYATSAQGDLADTALQPADLGAAGANLLAAQSIPDVRDLLAESPLLPLTSSRILRDEQSSFDPYKITFIAAGDSYAPDLSEQIGLHTASLAADGMNYIGNVYTTEGGASSSSADFRYSPNGQHGLLDNPGEGLTYPKSATPSYRIHVFYTIEPGVPGSFTVQSKTNAGPWINIPGGESIITDLQNPGNAPIGAGVFTYDFPTTELRQYRAVWNSGTVRILGMTRSNIWSGASSKGGLASYILSFSGQTVQSASTCPQEVFDTIIGTLKPDFATFKADDDATQMGYLQSYLDKWNTAWPTDWLLYSTHPTLASPTRELTDADRVVQTVAENNGYTFINCRKLFGTHAEMLSQGFMQAGDIHLTVYGSRYMERFVYASIQEAIKPQDAYSNPSYYETTKDYEVLSFTNALGSNLAAKRVWSAQFNATNGSFQFNIGPDGLGRMGWSSSGHLFITGGYSGWGYSSPPGKASRAPESTAEIFADDWITKPVLTLSAKSAHASDALEIKTSATQSSVGVRTAGIKPDGTADFTGLKVTLKTYSDHNAADADSSLLSGQMYKLTGSRVVYQKP